MFDAAEASVDVRIARLEPIAEGPSQQRCRGSRRPALHDVVLVVEKIRRIAGVEGKGLESIERRKDRARPFPTVA